MIPKEFLLTQEEINNLLKQLAEKGYNMEKNITNTVEHPTHYNRPGAMECIDEMLILFGPEETKTFCKINAWKYRYRAASKNGEEDIQKSDWYIKKFKEIEDGQRLVRQMERNNIIASPNIISMQEWVDKTY